MKLENLSVKKFLRLIICGILATSVAALLYLLVITRNFQVVLYGGLLTAVFLIWIGIFLYYFQKKLDLCQYFGQKKLKYYADFFSSSSSLCCGVI